MKPLNSTSVFIKWDPLHPQHINGVNQGYKIQAWKGNEKYRYFQQKKKIITIVNITYLSKAKQCTEK